MVKCKNCGRFIDGVCQYCNTEVVESKRNKAELIRIYRRNFYSKQREKVKEEKIERLKGKSKCPNCSKGYYVKFEDYSECDSCSNRIYENDGKPKIYAYSG